MKCSKWILMAVLVTVLPIASLAMTKKNLTVTEPVALGNEVLQPGNYQVAWEGNGSHVQVEFRAGDKTVAEAPAVVKEVHSPYQAAMDLKNEPGAKAKELTAINFSNVSLVFSHAGSAPSGR